MLRPRRSACDRRANAQKVENSPPAPGATRREGARTPRQLRRDMSTPNPNRGWRPIGPGMPCGLWQCARRLHRGARTFHDARRRAGVRREPSAPVPLASIGRERAEGASGAFIPPSPPPAAGAPPGGAPLCGETPEHGGWAVLPRARHPRIAAAKHLNRESRQLVSSAGFSSPRLRLASSAVHTFAATSAAVCQEMPHPTAFRPDVHRFVVPCAGRTVFASVCGSLAGHWRRTEATAFW